MFRKIYDCIFPMIANIKINKDIRKRIDIPNENDSIFHGIENPQSISFNILQEQYSETFKFKDKLEDKAKTNIIGVTISISLILGASTFLSNINNKFNCVWLSWAVFGLFTLAVLYMIIAGVISIKVLISENSVHTLSLSNQNSHSEYDNCISKNRLKNIIRNNYVYTSYECIRNSIVALFLILILSIIPIQTVQQNMPNSNSGDIHFVYSSDCINKVTSNEVRNDIESTINKAIINIEDIDNNQSLGIIDNNQKVFIQFTITDKNVCVETIKPYIN